MWSGAPVSVERTSRRRREEWVVKRMGAVGVIVAVVMVGRIVGGGWAGDPSLVFFGKKVFYLARDEALR